jgi:hypothetical protein
VSKEPLGPTMLKRIAELKAENNKLRDLVDLLKAENDRLARIIVNAAIKNDRLP